MSVPVYIAIYRPRAGNYFHWALFIKGAKNHVYEVTGEHPSFAYNHINANPASTGRHRANILIGYIDEGDITKINQLMPDVFIDNGNLGWTCQDWVIAALEEMCGDYILEEDDEDYREGLDEAKRKYYGPK